MNYKNINNMFKMFCKTHIEKHHTWGQKEKEYNIMMKVIHIFQKWENAPENCKKEKIIYEEDIDGIPYKPNSSTEEEDQEDDIYEVQNYKSKEKQPKQINPPKI